MHFQHFEDDEYVEVNPWFDRYDHLQVKIRGLEGTPYENGKFAFELKIPSNYPYSPPWCFCQTLIWHPNIDPSAPVVNTNICLDLINPELVGKVDRQTGASGWTPSKTISDVIRALKGLVHMVPPYWDPNKAINEEAGEMYLKNPVAFKHKAQDWTRKYAL
jgi:ubiquitin-protein ligase